MTGHGKNRNSPIYSYSQMCRLCYALEELVARKKNLEESMTHFHHAKINLTQQCRLDKKPQYTPSFGDLPSGIAAQRVPAFQCSTPDELYAGFIAPMDNYQTPSHSTVQFAKRPKIECYVCGKLGHFTTKTAGETVKLVLRNKEDHPDHRDVPMRPYHQTKKAGCEVMRCMQKKRDTVEKVGGIRARMSKKSTLKGKYIMIYIKYTLK